jgi:hypothetical protein
MNAVNPRFWRMIIIGLYSTSAENRPKSNIQPACALRVPAQAPCSLLSGTCRALRDSRRRYIAVICTLASLLVGCATKTPVEILGISDRTVGGPIQQRKVATPIRNPNGTASNL